MLDASHHISACVLARVAGLTRRVAFAIASFMAQNAPSWTGFQASSKSFWRDMFLSWGSCAIFPDACLTKRWENAQIPPKKTALDPWSWCTLHWKHWAAFLSPYGMRRNFNLKRPSWSLWLFYPMTPSPHALVGTPAEGQSC